MTAPVFEIVHRKGATIEFFAHRDLYDEPVATPGHPVDLHSTVARGPGPARPAGTSERDDGDISSFYNDHPARSPADPARFGAAVERRLDCLFMSRGLAVPASLGFGRRVSRAVIARSKRVGSLRRACPDRHHTRGVSDGDQNPSGADPPVRLSMLAGDFSIRRRRGRVDSEREDVVACGSTASRCERCSTALRHGSHCTRDAATALSTWPESS